MTTQRHLLTAGVIVLGALWFTPLISRGAKANVEEEKLRQGFSSTSEEDCNANGISDRTELPRFGLRAAANYRFSDEGFNAAVGDFDGDGDTDLVMTLGGNTIAVAYNDGDGTYLDPVPWNSTYALGGFGNIVAGDFDGDGLLDVAGTHSASLVSWLRNTGRQTFEPAGEVESQISNYNTVEIRGADMDGDGDLDLVAVGRGKVAPDHLVVSVLKNTGETFDQLEVVPTTSGVSLAFLAIADVDGNTSPDVVVAGQGYPHSVSVLTNGSNGQLTVANQVAFDGSLIAGTMGDFDGDGDADLAVVHNAGPVVAIAWNNGQGTFAVAQKYPLGDGYSSAQVAREVANSTETRGERLLAIDPDEDGDVDLLVSDSSRLLLLRNDSPGQFHGPEFAATTPFGDTMIAADLTADTTAELIISSVGSYYGFNILRSNRDGTYVDAASYAVGASPIAVVVGDLDGDGEMDVVVSNESSNDVSVLKNLSDGRLGTEQRLSAGKKPNGSAIADLDGDGDGDIAVANRDSNSVSVWRNDGNGLWTLASTITVGREPWAVGTGDLDGDGDVDLAVPCLIESVVTILDNDGSGTLGSPTLVPVGAAPRGIEVIDIDEDGDLDLITPTAHGVSVVLNQGCGRFGTALSLFPGEARSLVVADFNGDKHPDLAVNLYGGTLAILLGSGDGQFTERRDFGSFYLPAIGAGDLDRDGDIDILGITEDGIAILLNNGRAVFAPPIYFHTGASTPSLALTDFDKDGNLDAATPGRNALLVVYNEAVTPLSQDCNGDRIPDDCQLSENDCNANEIPDGCDVDSDGDGITDLCDACPDLDNRRDYDGDGIPDCFDNCLGIKNPDQSDRDGDTYGDACDGCPDDPKKQYPDFCGCGIDVTIDSDGDHIADCRDACPTDPAKSFSAGHCGCGQPELDIDHDGVVDCGTPAPTKTSTATQTAGGPAPTLTPTITATPTVSATHAPAHFIVDSTQDATDSNIGDGQCFAAAVGCTLRAAIQETNVSRGLDDITVPAGTYVLTIAGNREDACAKGDLDVRDDLILIGAGAGATIVDGNALDRVLQVHPGVTASFSDFTIRHGRNTDSSGQGAAGGVLNTGNLTMTGCTVTENVAPDRVGTLSGVGTGAIINSGKLTLQDCSVTKNTGAHDGGILNYGELYVNGGILNENRAGSWGGALRNLGTATITTSRMEKNSGQAPESGTIYNIGSLTLTDSTIAETSEACGLWNEGGRVTAERLRIVGNSGGGILNAGTITLTAATVQDNKAVMVTGGGIDNTGTAFITASTIAGNEGYTGGGLANSGNATVVNSTVSGNRAFSRGGGLHNLGELQLRSATITDNTTLGSAGGGGLFGEPGGTVHIQNSILAGNSAGMWPDCSGTLSSQGYNLIGNTAGCLIVGDTVGNIIDKDPQLGTLQASGGPTLTQAPDPNSPVVDAGMPPGSGCEPTDQRGAPRPAGAGCDIGAVEVAAMCGDGRLDEGEECDDGNTVDGDCCSVLCERKEIAGDCNGDMSVTVDELIQGTNIALGNGGLERCPAFDSDGNGRVTIDELVRAVNFALEGC
jgi:cysteine-rich repeat protein